MPDIILPIISLFLITVVLVILISEKEKLIGNKNLLLITTLLAIGAALNFGATLSNIYFIEILFRHFELIIPLFIPPLLLHYIYVRALPDKKPKAIYITSIYSIPLLGFILDGQISAISNFSPFLLGIRLIYLLSAIWFIFLLLKKRRSLAIYLSTTLMPPIFLGSIVILLADGFSLTQEGALNIGCIYIGISMLVGLLLEDILIPNSIITGKIKTQIFSILISVSSIIVILATSISYAITTDQSNTKIQEELAIATESHAHIFTTYLESINDYSDYIYNSKEFVLYKNSPSRYTQEILQNKMNEIVHNSNSLLEISIYLDDKFNFGSANSTVQNVDTREFKNGTFSVVKQDSKLEFVSIFVTEFELSQNKGKLVLFMPYDATLEKITHNHTNYSTFSMFLTDKKGLLLTPMSDYDKSQIRSLSLNSACASNEGEINIKEGDFISNEIYLEGHEVCLTTQIKSEEVFSRIRDSIGVVVLSSLFSLLFVTIVADLVGSLLSDPLLKIKNDLKIIKDGDLNHKSKINLKNELGDLASSINELTAELKDIYDNFDNKVQHQTSDLTKQKEILIRQQKQMVKILEDLEKEKTTSEILADQLKKFELAVKNSSDHIIITDSTGTIIYANKAAGKITGYLQEEIIGQKAGSKQNWGGQMEPEFYKRMWHTIATKKKSFEGEFTNKRKNGALYQVKASISPILDKDKNIQFFVGIERDITQEKKIDKVKTEFVSLASHQLRTPLSAISWYTEMLLDEDAGPITIGQKEYLLEIYEGNKRMIDLVSALLNVSRLELGTFSIEPEKIDLFDLIKTAIKEMLPKATENQIKIETDTSKEKLEIEVDRKLIYIVFQNLISNAVKYSKKKGKVKISHKVGKTYVEISIKDNGIGIPKAEQKEIFGKLFRASNARDQVIEGTGLGLYIVKAILDHTEGKISFKSTPGKGTTFTIRLKLKGMKEKKGSKKLE